jgi:hypothetical protein
MWSKDFQISVFTAEDLATSVYKDILNLEQHRTEHQWPCQATQHQEGLV